MIFRREPIHKKLARQASLDLSSEPRGDPAPVDPGPHWGETGIHGLPRPRRWDAVGAAEAPGLTGDELHSVALPNGDLVVDEEQPEAATVGPLAQAIAQSVEPPYRAEAVRHGGDAWAVAARRIDVTELDDAPGQELQLAVSGLRRPLAFVTRESPSPATPVDYILWRILRRMTKALAAAGIAEAAAAEEALRGEPFARFPGMVVTLLRDRWPALYPESRAREAGLERRRQPRDPLPDPLRRRHIDPDLAGDRQSPR